MVGGGEERWWDFLFIVLFKKIGIMAELSMAGMAASIQLLLRKLDAMERKLDELSSRSPEAGGKKPAGEIMTIEEAADFMGMSKAHIYRLSGSGALARVKIGRKTRFYRRDVEAYLASCREKSLKEVRVEAAAYCRAHPLHRIS